mgnify:CR=1 FL=1|jgi:hypothetical protein
MELSKRDIEDRIFTVRGIQVMIDRDLANLYQVETKVLNQAVKRNINRFPEAFRFHLTTSEKIELVTNCDRLESLKHSSTNPYVFTEQGVLGRDVKTIGKHINNVFNEGELDEKATVANFATVQNEGGRMVERNFLHNNFNTKILWN